MRLGSSRISFMLNRFSLVLCAGAVLSLLLFGTAPAKAQSGGARVVFDPPVLEVGAGQVEQVNIVLENAQEAYGIDVRASFDPSVIEIVDDDPGKSEVQMTPGEFLKPDFLVRNIANNGDGTLQYVATQVNPTPPATGSGIVLSIRVRGKTQGASAAFAVTAVEIADRRGVKLPVQGGEGTVQVVAPKPETPTPVVEPTATPERIETISTRAAAVATRPRATPVAATRSDDSNMDLITNAILLIVALGGCFGAVLVLGIGIFFLMRKPRAMPPQYPPR